MALSQAHKALIGIMMINFATGFVNDWGVISIYFLSYFHYHGAPIQIKASTNSLMLISMVIPVAVCLAISIKVAHCVGFVKLIRYCAVVYLLVPLLMFIDFNFVMFLVCDVVIAASVYALTLPPLFHCLYSHCSEYKSMATGIVIGSFSLGAIFWNIVITLVINPDNTIPDIDSGDPNLTFFPKQISSRVPLTFQVVYLVSGLLFFFGSLLTTANQNYKQDEEYEIDLNLRHDISQFQKPESLQKQQKIQTIPHQQATSQIKTPVQRVNIKQYMTKNIPLLLFVINISACLYQSYVQLYTKLIYMSFLQDDHLISIGLMITIVSSAIFGLFWGHLADKKGPPFAIICFIFIDLIFKIYSSIARSRVGFIIAMILLGSTDKTMLILFGPTLIDCYGLAVATQMLPFKGVSGIVTIILASILGYVFAQFSPQNALYFICIFSILNLGIGGYLAYLIKQQKLKKKQQIKNQPQL